jgi:hypothetical protein
MTSREYYQEHRDELRLYNRVYLSGWRKKQRELPEDVRRPSADKQYENKSPEGIAKRKARLKAQYAIRRGRLVRDSCEKSGCLEIAEAHHDDYSKPLEVRWLCRLHHEELHHGELNIRKERG